MENVRQRKALGIKREAWVGSLSMVYLVQHFAPFVVRYYIAVVAGKLWRFGRNMGIVWVFRGDKSEEHGSYARALQIDMEETKGRHEALAIFLCVIIWTVYRCASDFHVEQVAEN